ncbi:MAG TPA: DUF255 domain-containing protein [Candidatus Tumulicola sp.]|jgi:hypothetical protein
MSEFRFSPRPNRAGEIAWMPWEAASFERARTEDKPILLSISAVWCHWCHVMDETSYSDSTAIETINQRYVPIRVDNDRRPDVNARYNMGGWPTTAFLAPDGQLLTGATYLPPQQFNRALLEIADFYASNKSAIAERAAVAGARIAPDRESLALDAEVPARLAEAMSANFDDEYGGFGDSPKFPQPELLEFLLQEWRATGNERCYEMVRQTLVAMAGGGTYDHVEGGFFRYSTTRDWSVPHFEKMAEDHGGLLRVLAELEMLAPQRELRSALVSAVRYVRATLRDPQTGLFAGSQDADEEYFELPLERRREREAPFVDRTSYTNWTCGLAGAFLFSGRTLSDENLIREGIQTLDTIAATAIDAGGFAYHVMRPGAQPEVRGLLTDQIAYLRASVDAHEVSGEARFLRRARELADRLLERFQAAGGGFYDRVEIEETLGRLELEDRPIGDNGVLAECLLRLTSLTYDGAYRDAAVRALEHLAPSAMQAGSFAAAYARAIRRLTTLRYSIRIVGAPGETGAYRMDAARLPAIAAIRTIEEGAAATEGLPASPVPAAYACTETACGAPVTDPAALRGAYEALAGAQR